MGQGCFQDNGRQWQSLAESGQYERAFDMVRSHLVAEGGDVDALNDAGTILFCMGRGSEAVGYLEKAARLAQGDKAGQVLWNLSEAYLQEGRCAEAAGLFEQMESLGVLNVDVLNRAANAFLNKGALAAAIEMILRSLEISPQQEVLQPMVEIIRSKRPKVGIVGQGAGAARLADWLGRRFVAELYQGQSFETAQKTASDCRMNVFYGCDEMTIRAARQNQDCRRIFVLSGEDIYSDRLEYICWKQADEIIAVGGPKTVESLRQRLNLSGQKPQITGADEAVDMQRYAFTARSRGKRLAAMGPFYAGSNIMFLLQCMQKLHYIDPDFRLYMAGGFADRTVEEYTYSMISRLGLEAAVSIDGPVINDIVWLKDKHYFVSADIAGAAMGPVWAAMATGLRPVVHYFPNAEQILDGDFLFDISEQFCGLICSGGYEPARYRRFVGQRQSRFGEFKAVNDTLLRLERQIILSQKTIAADVPQRQPVKRQGPEPMNSRPTRPAVPPLLPWERADEVSAAAGKN